MILVKVKTKGFKFTIPIPYAALNVAISILSSKFLQRTLNKWTKESFKRKKLNFTFPPIDKRMLQPIVKEMKNNKGLVLVDVKAQDGTEVKVRL